ncbi:hypothetical protein DB345_08400 [Spartobacteria bacterium LR76]|nr:hypothetical protein DB345_08400 [Spartobacteria bacterium LR76]
MPLSRVLLAACALPLMLHAQSADPAKPFSYADTVALVKERALSPEQRRAANPNNGRPVIHFNDPAQGEKTEPAPSERIYVAGPTQTDEIYFSNGKEVQKSVPYCYILETAAVRNPSNLWPIVLDGHNVNEERFQLLLYRADQNEPAFKLVGKYEEIKNSQFPFKNGDLIVVSVIR